MTCNSFTLEVEKWEMCALLSLVPLIKVKKDVDSTGVIIQSSSWFGSAPKLKGFSGIPLVCPVHLLQVTTCVPEPSIIVYRGIGCTKANQCDGTAHSNAWGVQWHRQILWSIWKKTETDGRLKEEMKTDDAFPQEKLTDWQQITLQTLQKMMTIIMTIQHYVHLRYRFRSILK